MNQTSEDDVSIQLSRIWSVHRMRRTIRVERRHLIKGAMRAVLVVVMIDVEGLHLLEMAAPEDEEPIRLRHICWGWRRAPRPRFNTSMSRA